MNFWVAILLSIAMIVALSGALALAAYATEVATEDSDETVTARPICTLNLL